MQKFLIALQFLTILPVKIKSKIKEKDFGDSLIYFPVIGALIGLVLVLTLSVFASLPHLVTVVLIMISSIIVTGGIHLDGFADTCDGFYGSRPKEQILKIMRDARIGAMGVIGIVSLLLLKFTLMASLPKNILWKLLIMMAVFSRWSQGIACYMSSYAREEGKAEYFITHSSKKGFFAGGFFVMALFMLLMQFKGLVLMFFALFPVLLFITYVKRKIGGMTGDTIGATSEIAEVGILLFALICSVR